MSKLLLESEWTDDLGLTGAEDTLVETDPWAAHAAARKPAPADRFAINNLDQWLDLCA